jgi:hypothetical protein
MLARHSQIPKSLSALLSFMDMPMSTCIKGLDVVIAIINRTNKICRSRLPQPSQSGRSESSPPSSPRSINPYVQQFIDHGVPTLLPCLRQAHAQSVELLKRCTTLDLIFKEDSQQRRGSMNSTGSSSESQAPPNSEKDFSAPSASNLAAMFGLTTPPSFNTTGANKRRVLRGNEDGDIRLIENAVGNLCIMETGS